MNRRGFMFGSLAVTGGLAALRTAAQSANPAAAGEAEMSTDVLVCGGGPAGIAAACTAARQGAKVLLLERYGRLGGMAVQGLVGPLMGTCDSPFLKQALKHIGGHHFDPNRLDLQYAELVQNSGASLLLHAWAAEALMDGGRVAGVRAVTKRGMLRIAAKRVVDATGDGDVAFAAGAPFEQGRPGDRLMQPVSVMFLIGGFDEGKQPLLCGSEEQARVVRLPEGTWEEIVTRGQKSGELAPAIGVIRIYTSMPPCYRVVNATQLNGIDGTDPRDLTRAELECRRQAFQVVEFLRKHAPGYENVHLVQMPGVVGVRETRRFLGMDYLQREDLIAGRRRPDAVVRGAFFPIDIHNPAGSGQAEGSGPGRQGQAARVKPYDIPYGCLVPKQTDGLLLAGRCISGSHDAHASYRVMCIAMGTGAAAGTAAALSVKRGCQPRDLDVPELQKALA